MSDKFFLDTNILVYSFDQREPQKMKIAQELISEALTSSRGIVSYQVVQEFLNVATRKFAKPLSDSDAKLYLDQVLMPLCEVFPSDVLYRSALDIQRREGFSFYDSLIVASALLSGCTRLLSEDLQPGQKIGEMTVQDPFALGT